MESYLPISYLNDFIFCPRSIYFHNLYGNKKKSMYQSMVQTKGLNAHKTIDSETYSSAKSIFQGMEVYSQKYNIAGKIDTYDATKKQLVERKKKIKVIYDGYIFQLYAQYFCLTEMGYVVNTIKLYSLDDNKSYPIDLPENNSIIHEKFIKLIEQIRSFNLNSPFQVNVNKCRACIYKNVCDKAALD